MSSHHIIRENQEPAIAILDSSYNNNILNEALEWSPYIITINSCVQKLIGRGVKLDAVLAEKDDLVAIKKAIREQSDVKLVETQEVSLERVLKFLEENDHKAVHVFSPFEIDITELAQSSKLVINIIADNLKWAFIKSGRVKKWFPKGARIKTAGRAKIMVTNRDEYQMSDQALKFESEGMFFVQSAEAFWLGEYLI